MPNKKKPTQEAIMRINLCFDTSDPKQKLVYDYLNSLKKQKTKMVVSWCLDNLTNNKANNDASGQQWTRIEEKIDALLTHVRTAQFSKSTDVTEEAVDTTPVPERTTQTVKAASSTSYEMDEDVFADMMSMMSDCI